MAELAATRRAEVEAIKHFLSKQEDIYRVPYGRQVSVFPRQCVFFGTTNDLTFLRDQTGNRRFWPVVVGENQPTKSLWRDLTDEELDQIWAEAVQAYKGGERLYLTPELESEARQIQEAHTQESEKAGAVREFLDMLLPADWDERDIGQRRTFIHGGDFGKEEVGTIQRERVCVMEIWCELFFGNQKDLTRAVSLELHEILRNTPGWKPYTKGTGKLLSTVRTTASLHPGRDMTGHDKRAWRVRRRTRRVWNGYTDSHKRSCPCSRHSEALLIGKRF